MNRLLKMLSSSIGRKLVMAVTGLLLCGFLLVHLAGNILLYVGPDAYNEYAHKLHEQEALLMVGEAGLILLFAAHVFLAIRLTMENRAARRKRYKMKESKIEERFSTVSSENWMFTSGAIVLGFVILHLIDFTFEARTDFAYADFSPYTKAVAILQNPISFAVYLAGSVILGIHLGHGVRSAIQTLGLHHVKYNGLISLASFLFASLVGVGFASFPLWAMLFHRAG
ncbi:MAG: succinate dehydrogenase cytochrome b subunit [Planctomycetaceae bacterium]|nr:succinate dehydrogenase cytochrome b subunit [Planctomycetaceae bacterium]